MNDHAEKFMDAFAKQDEDTPEDVLPPIPVNRHRHATRAEMEDLKRRVDGPWVTTLPGETNAVPADYLERFKLKPPPLPEMTCPKCGAQMDVRPSSINDGWYAECPNEECEYEEWEYPYADWW